MNNKKSLMMTSPSKQNLPIALRHTHAGDIAFIFNSWLESYRGSLHMKNISNTVYYAGHHNLIERIMKRSEAVIACNPEDQTQIYGYIVYEIITGVLVLHYVYVKQPYRKLGIMKQLLEKAGRKEKVAFVYTHETYSGSKLALKFSAFYNPYPCYQGYKAEEGKDESKES
jgi:hypothetical protein